MCFLPCLWGIPYGEITSFWKRCEDLAEEIEEFGGLTLGSLRGSARGKFAFVESWGALRSGGAAKSLYDFVSEQVHARIPELLWDHSEDFLTGLIICESARIVSDAVASDHYSVDRKGLRPKYAVFEAARVVGVVLNE